MRTRFGQGRDWPIGYDDLTPYYEQAERELGVSADVEDQAYLGITFEPGLRLPDARAAAVLPRQDGRQGHRRHRSSSSTASDYELKVRTFPQARNGIPNPAYDGGKGFTPVGAVSTHQVEEGGRCQGNINCVPICPVQAKYNAGKTLARRCRRGSVDLLAQTVASKVHRRRGHRPGQRRSSTRPTATATRREHTTGTVRGRIVRARRQRDRERPADAGLRAAQQQRAGRAQPDGPCVPAQLGAAARDRRHDARHRLHRRDRRPARRRIPRAARRPSPSTSTTTAGAGPTGSPYTDLIDLVDDAEPVRRRPASRRWSTGSHASCCWRS